MNALATARSFEVETAGIDLLGPNVVKLALLPTSGARARYLEGQYLSLKLPDGDARSYSYATACAPDGRIELHVRLHANGKFSEHLRHGLALGDRLDAVGPYGDCIWRPTAREDDPILMLATGTGIAPLKAMLDASLAKCSNPIWLYWGGVVESDLYIRDYFDALARRNPRFRFTPVLSDADRNWSEARGFVQDIAGAQHGNLLDYHVYACGAPVMVNAAQALFTERLGLDPDHFYADAFEVSSATTEGQNAQRVELSITRPDHPRARVDLPTGTSLMAALRERQMIAGICGGRQSCGTCRVTLSPAHFKRITPPLRAEQRLLQALPRSGPFDRLSCQLPVGSELSNIHITIPRETA